MRYVPVTKLKEGMVLGQPFYGKTFEVLLAQGMTLNRAAIERINELGYAGVYIWEEQSRDVAPKELIPMEKRLACIRAAREFLQMAEEGNRSRKPSRVTKERQQQVIMPIIQAIIQGGRRVADVVDLKPYNYYDYYHATNVVVLSLLVGIELGIAGTQLYELGMAALLHDVGNAFVPKHILDKPGKLTEAEYDLVKSHSQKGFEWLRENFDISIDACMGALQHHENFDGTGYPNQLKAGRISIYGRIIAITDVYDALVSRRPFREAMLPREAMSYIHSKSGIMFDPEIVQVMDRVIALYPVGTCVELDNGVKCIVVDNYPGAPARPRVRLLSDSPHQPTYLDLLRDPALKSVNVVNFIDV